MIFNTISDLRWTVDRFSEYQGCGTPFSKGADCLVWTVNRNSTRYVVYCGQWTVKMDYRIVQTSWRSLFRHRIDGLTGCALRGSFVISAGQ